MCTKVKVTFWSGRVLDFLAPEDMLQTDFEKMARGVGGKIKRIVFC